MNEERAALTLEFLQHNAPYTARVPVKFQQNPTTGSSMLCRKKGKNVKGKSEESQKLNLRRKEISCLRHMRTDSAMSLPKFLYALPHCGGLHRSASAAVTPDGGSSWMAAEELEPLTQKLLRSEQHAGRRGRKTWYEGVLGIAGGEGRASWPKRRGNSSRSGRFLGPRIGMLQRTAAQWLSAIARPPVLSRCSLGARLVPELSSGKESHKGHKHRARLERTPDTRIVLFLGLHTNIINLELFPNNVPIELSRIAFPQVVLLKSDRADFAQEERLDLPYWTMI